MNKYKNILSLCLVLFTVAFGSAVDASAQKRDDRAIRDAVRSLNSKIDDLEYNLRYHMQSTSADPRQVGNSSDVIRGLKDSINGFQENYDRRRENRQDVNEIIDAAKRLDNFLLTAQVNRQVQDDWTGAKRQIERLASNYGINVNWNGGPVSQRPYDPVITEQNAQNGTFSVGLSGTYDLDMAASENVDEIVSDISLATEQRSDLKDKLTAPGQIALDIRGNQVTLATSNAAPVTFIADGRDKVENSANGSLRVRATLSGQTLTVSSVGGETDYTIVFTSLSNGRSLKVSRRITTEYLSQTVFAESVYNKTDSVARLNIGGGSGTIPTTTGTTSSTTYDPNGGYSDNDQSVRTTNGQAPIATTARPGNYVIPNGSIVTAVLENEINTAASQNNDRFRLTVQSPPEFRGAVIEGYITGVGRSGKVTGRSNLTFNFERITLRDGQTYDFAGNLQSVRDAYGKIIRIDNEGTAQGTDQTRETAKRGGIGAGLGAIIGAIAGGAKGAAIGAIVGAGGGAATVAVQGRDDLRLQPGSTITIQASGPNTRAYPEL